MAGNLADGVLNAALPYTGATVRAPQVPGIQGCMFQATVVGTGAVTATVIVEGSIDGSNFVVLDTYSLTGTTTHTLGSVKDPWPNIRTRITASSGTGAAVTVFAGYF